MSGHSSVSDRTASCPHLYYTALVNTKTGLIVTVTWVKHVPCLTQADFGDWRGVGYNRYV